MKKILVPCDFSAPAREAFKAAVHIAAQTRGTVVVLHVIYLPVVYDNGYDGAAAYSPELLALWQEDAEKSLEAMVMELPKGSPKVETRVEIGAVLPLILDTIEQDNIDLVVMGKTGRSGVAHFLVGSTTEKVVRHAPVPVLAVNDADFATSVKNIVLPSELALDQVHFMEKVKQLQQFFHATIHLLYVNTPNHFQRDTDAHAAMQDVIKTYHLANCKPHFVNDYTEEAGIAHFAADKKMDMVVMGTHARKGLAHLVNGSVSEDLANNFAGAVWTCNLHAR